MKAILYSLVVTLTLSFSIGCTLDPKYTRPKPPVDVKELEGEVYKPSQVDRTGLKPEDLQKIKWVAFFPDENLQKIISKALENNRDLKLSAINVERARALYGVQKSELIPSVGGNVSGTVEKISKDLSSTGRSRINEQYTINLGIASWEIDFFGYLRSLSKQALENYLATEEAYRSARISLIASVAQAYATLAADMDALGIARDTLKVQEDYYKIIKRRYEMGLVTELDLRRAQTQVDTARADVARYIRQVAQDENALNLLVGTSFSKELLPRGLDAIKPPTEIYPGLSSEVLLNRPDVLQAEHQLKGTYANIGAARAALFPRISLTTSVGTASDELLGLFGGGTGVWTFAPKLATPIFDARAWAALRVTKVDQQAALTQYEKSIQIAFKEVLDTLALYNTIDEQLSAQQSLVKALEETHRLSIIRYEKGIDNYLNVLEAQRSLYVARQQLVTLKLSHINSRIKLYAVLGGGVN